MTQDHIKTIEGLRQAAAQHESVYGLLMALAACMPFINDGSYQLTASEPDIDVIKAAVHAAAFVAYDLESK